MSIGKASVHPQNVGRSPHWLSMCSWQRWEYILNLTLPLAGTPFPGRRCAFGIPTCTLPSIVQRITCDSEQPVQVGGTTSQPGAHSTINPARSDPREVTPEVLRS